MPGNPELPGTGTSQPIPIQVNARQKGSHNDKRRAEDCKEHLKEGRNKETCPPAHPSPQFRHPPPRAGNRYPLHPGLSWPQANHHHRALHPGLHSQPKEYQEPIRRTPQTKT